MTGEVKKRSYDGSRRRAASAGTRRRILEAARARILGDGYRATTVAAVAADAGVSVATVYELVGRKPVLLRELIEQDLSGTDHAVPAEERDHVRALQAEPDPVRKLAIYASAIRATHGRMAPLFLALRDAAATEPEARAVWEQISRRRADNMRRLAAELRDAGGLRADLDIEEAADTVWVTNSPEVYVLLTAERGWTPERYERWLLDTWCRLLLGEGQTARPGDDPPA